MELGKPLTHLLYKLHRNFASSLTSPDVYLLEFTKASLDPRKEEESLPWSLRLLYTSQNCLLHIDSGQSTDFMPGCE